MEWFEEGETKGKEIDMAAIESLNPDVTILKPGEELKFTQLQRVSCIFNIFAYVRVEILMVQLIIILFLAAYKDSCGYSEDEISVSMTQSGHFSDDEFNSNQFSSQTTSFQVFSYQN